MTAPDQVRDRGRHASPDLAHTLCDWCERPVIGEEAWDWHRTRGHPRCIASAAVQVWVSRQIVGEIPPPIDAPDVEGMCAWCFEPIGDRRAVFNGGVGHVECARHAYDCVAGDDAMPWPIPEPSVYERAAFLERLARAAAKHKLPARRLRLAIKEAMNV